MLFLKVCNCDVLTLCIPRLSVPRDHVRIGIESVQRSGARDIYSRSCDQLRD